MQRLNCLLCSSLLLASLLAAPADAARVVLNNGHELHAEVLKESDDAIVLDLGFELLRVPRDHIAQLLEDTEPNAPAPAVARNSWQLYYTARLAPATIEENARRYGEAVVMVNSPSGQGSGFLITPQGHLITNYHVIAEETRIRVTVFSRTETGFEQTTHRQVRILALSPYNDLALLKIEGADEPFTYACLGDMDRLEAGRQVFAIGNPLGLTRTVSQGIVSTKNRNHEGRLYIQTTTDINPGNSGGPLFNLRGEVIGVTSMGYLFMGGLNFAIPVDVVKRFIENRDAFAYDEDNPNAGYRYLQPAGRTDKSDPPPCRLPAALTPANPQPGQ